MQGNTIPFRPVEVQLGASSFSVAPGGSVVVPYALVNHTSSEDYFYVTLQGIPASWAVLDLPLIHLAAGERREASLTIQSPDTSPLSAGIYPVVLRAASQADREIWGEAGFDLQVGSYENTAQAAPYVSSGRIEVALATTRFSVAPGEVLVIPVRVTNRGTFEDTFYLGIEGIPPQWLSGPAQLARLAPGASSEMNVLIQPTAGSLAGAYPFRLRLASQADPSQNNIVEAMLNLAAASQFVSDLSPRRIEGGRMARVRIHNLSSSPDSYTLRWHSQQGDLDFVPTIHGPVEVMPGDTGVVDFTASPRSLNWFGQPATLPYTVTVLSSGGEGQSHHGNVINNALIPIWVLPALLVFFLTLICGLGYLWNWNQNRLAAARATAQAEVGLVGVQTATAAAAANAEATVSAINAANAVGTAAVNATAKAVVAAATNAAATAAANAAATARIPTPTPMPTATSAPIPTNTPVPTFTPIAPTSTATRLPPTPTNTVPPPTSTLTPIPSPTFTLTPLPVVISPTPTQLSLPVTGQQLFLFVSDSNGGPHLYLYNSADNTTQPLTSGASAQMDPAWSPDGTKIAFTSNQAGNNDIYVMNADGSNPVDLTNNLADDRYPAWSPDGKQIAFTTNRDGNNEIYVMNADGSSPVNLTKSPASDFKPAWYTSGGLFTSTSRILFTSDRGGNTEIYAMNTDGTNPVNLTKNPADDSYPAVPPNGGRIAFVTNRDGNNEIYTMDLDGSHLANLTNNPAGDSQPAWSRDGKWIAFTSNRSGSQEIFIMAADGSKVTQVTRSTANDTQPAWR